MADTERDILRDAIIGTEKEIFGDAFGKEDVTLDETGDRSREAMGDGLEGQHESDEDEEAEGEEGEEGEGEPGKIEAKAETQPEARPEPKVDEPQGRVPAGRLREQTERTRTAETERDELKARLEAAESESRKQIEALNARFETVLATIRQQRPADQPKPTDPPKPDAPPDLFENPQAFAEYIMKGAAAQVQPLSKQMEDLRVNMSMENARVRHQGAFDAAFQTVTKLDPQSPDNRELVRRIYAAPNPGEALVQWHKRTETLREVGDDPAAYKAKIAEDTRKALMEDQEFRKQLLADLRAEAETGDNGRPRTSTRLPASLNRAAGGNIRAPIDPGILDGSDRAVFDGAFT